MSNEPHTPREIFLNNRVKQGNPNNAPRCNAIAKTTKKQCRAPAMKNKTKCRMHGGASMGPKTPEGLARSKKARWKHGIYSREQKIERKLLQLFLKHAKNTLQSID